MVRPLKGKLSLFMRVHESLLFFCGGSPFPTRASQHGVFAVYAYVHVEAPVLKIEVALGRIPAFAPRFSLTQHRRCLPLHS